jgi:hypothetical protein
VPPKTSEEYYEFVLNFPVIPEEDTQKMLEANRKRRRGVWKRIQANDISETVKSIDDVKWIREDRSR